jgi:hypothetical protein
MDSVAFPGFIGSECWGGMDSIAFSSEGWVGVDSIAFPGFIGCSANAAGASNRPHIDTAAVSVLILVIFLSLRCKDCFCQSELLQLQTSLYRR